jgi:hypothetical protein
MSKASEKTTPEEQTPEAGQAETQQQRAQVQIDDSKAVCSYANFCRVTGTPEELIIDFGLNNQPMGVATDRITVDQRIVVNFFTAKRLLAALNMSVQRHEGVFGVLETDVQKRVQPSARVTQQPRPSS